MFNIDKYLEKFSGLISKGAAAKDIVISETTAVTGAIITKPMIELKDGMLFIRSSPIVKNTILIRKKALIERLAAKGVKVNDIR